MTVDDDVAAIQDSLDSMAEDITKLAQSFRMEKLTNGNLSEESREQLVTLTAAAMATKLALHEAGAPVFSAEAA